MISVMSSYSCLSNLILANNILIFCYHNIQEVDAYVDRIMGYITSFIDFAVDAVCGPVAILHTESIAHQAVIIPLLQFQIKTEIGRCRPFTAAYTGLHITFCSKTLDGLVSTIVLQVGPCMLILGYAVALVCVSLHGPYLTYCNIYSKVRLVWKVQW